MLTPGGTIRVGVPDSEKAIRAYPEGWLWMYKHWRYLPGTERDPIYPDYANRYEPFRKMVDGE